MRHPGRTVWSAIAAVAYKEAAVLRHDRPFLAVVLMQPVMMLLLFGFALSTIPRNVPWAVLDRSRTAASRRLTEEISVSGHFLRPLPVGSYDEGRALLQHGAALALLVIPEGFARDRAHGHAETEVLLDGSDPLSAARVGAYLTQIAARFATDATHERRRPEARLRRAGPIDLRQRFWFNATLADRKFFLSAFAAMLLTNLCLSATSLALVGERENGTYEQMLSLPTTPVELVLGKLLPYVGICYVELLIALIPAGLLFGVWPQGSWFTLLLVTLPFVLASLAAGTLISSVATTSAQSVFLSVFFIMPSFVLSGVMMPYQLMPDGIRQLGGLLPLRWYQIALRRIVERGAGLADVALPFLVLSAMFAVLLALVAWRTKPRLG